MPIAELANQLLHFATDSLRMIWMPLGIWTVLAGLFLTALRLTPESRPLVKYQAATALLWSLPLGIFLALFLPLSIAAPEGLQLALEAPSAASLAAPIGEPPAGVVETPWRFEHGIGLLTILLASVGLWNLAGISGEALRIFRTGKTIGGLPLGDVDAESERLRRLWKIGKPVYVSFTSSEHVPMTFGWRRPFIVLPVSLRDKPDALRMTLVHELSHIRHRDYLRRLVEQAIGSLFFFHPLVKRLVDRTDQYREMACDNEVLQQQGISARDYASLLLEFAQPNSRKTHLAISMADSNTNLKQRIKAMKEYRFFTPGALNSTTIGLALAAVLLAVSAMMVACEVKFVEDNSITIIESPAQEPAVTQSVAPNAPPAGQSDGETFMIVEDMPELIGGLASIQNAIEYPAIAKAAGVEGRVFIQFVVDETGAVQDPVVVRGIGAGCDEEAVRAVKLAKFKPGRQRGQAVRVKMSLPITFKLEETANSVQEIRAKFEQKLKVLEMHMATLKTKAEEAKESANEAEARSLNLRMNQIKMEIVALQAQLETVMQSAQR